MLKLLARDANSHVRGDTQFPFLRSFDAYAGQGWASGHQGFAHGNNEESSSESMMYATATILFGQAVGDDSLRDAGIYLYTTQQQAIGQYWFDKDNATFPAGFNHDTVGIVWGGGATYGTWWTANPEEIHGINMLPITGGSLYHGAWKSDIVANINELRTNNGGPETEWRDIIWNYLAIADPAQALSRYGGGIDPESGESRAHTYHWITSLDTFGTPDHSVTSSARTYAVLSKNGARTYVAYNPAATAVTVSFSDGQTISVPARSTAWRGPAGSGVDAGTATAPPTSPPPPGSRNAFAAIQAESFDQQSGVTIHTGGDGGQHLGAVGNGDWALFRGVDFGAQTARQFSAKVASGAAGGVSGLVEVRIGSPTATPVGSFALANTGGWQSWRTVPANISALTGKQDVYLTFTSGQPADFVNVDSFLFTQ